MFLIFPTWSSCQAQKCFEGDVSGNSSQFLAASWNACQNW